MSTATYEKHACPIAQSLVELGDQWTLLIVRDALNGLRRFSEFQESLGISRNLLTQRLGQLCDADILMREPIEGSKRFAYAPTQKCRDLRLVLLAMAQWGERWRDDPDITHLDVRETASGEPVSVELVRRADNGILGPDAITVTRRKKRKRRKR